MMKKAIAALFFLFVPPAFASVVVHETVEEMSIKSPLVLRGTVLDSEARRDPRGRSINTYTRIRVDEVLKGDFNGASTVTVRQPGGTVDDLTMEVPGAAQFKKGEEVVLFLEDLRSEPGVYILRSLGAAKFTLSADPTKPVTQDLMGLSFARSAGQRASDGSAQNNGPLNRTQFLTQIRRAISSGKTNN